MFLKKVCLTSHLYEICKSNVIEKENIMEILFYLIKLLKMLLKSVEKLRLLGKFYRHKCPIVFQNSI